MLAIAQSEGFETYALSFRYGQRHRAELDAAAADAWKRRAADRQCSSRSRLRFSPTMTRAWSMVAAGAALASSAARLLIAKA